MIALIGTSTVVRSAVADSSPQLPDKTPAQVLALAAGSHVQALSGSVTARMDLGLPAPPRSLRHDSGGAPSAAQLVTRILGGTTNVRVWLDGPQRVRLQTLDQMAETDVVRDGRDVWTYSSRGNTATHLVLPAGDHTGTSRNTPSTTPGTVAPPTPQALAQKLLAAAGPTTTVTLDRPARVAGRDAYVLKLTPRTDKTLVADATISVDAATGLPLRVVVDARGQKAPAVDVGFTSLDLARPAASHFSFTPPAGATVQKQTLPQHASDHRAGTGAPAPDTSAPGTSAPDTSAPGTAAPKVIGSGWTAVLEAVLPQGAQLGSPQPGSSQPGSSQPGAQAGSAQLSQLLDAVARPVSGGRMLTTALVSVYLRDDGHVFVGAVPPAALLAAAAGR